MAPLGSNSGYTSPSFLYSLMGSSTGDFSTEDTPLVSSSSHSSSQIHRPSGADTDDYEVIKLISFFLGSRHTALYQTSLMALMYIGLLAYSQVFVGSLSSIVSQQLSSSYLSTVIFAIVVIPLSCTELDEQVSIQFLLALARFVAIFVMIGGCLFGLIMEEEEQSGEDIGFEVGLVQWRGFGVAFSTALFSQLFQHSVPGLVRPLGRDKRGKVPVTFAYALATTYGMYIMLGVAAAVYFGTETRSSVNLNFNGLYTGSVIATVASKVVVFFPALDTLSVFPLIANTLGNNLLFLCETNSNISSGLISFSKFVLKNKPPEELGKASQKFITVIFRLLAAIPPLILSTFVTDLSISMQLAGVAGLYVAFFAPALLQRESAKRVLLEDGCYNGWYSNVRGTSVVLAFATFSLAVVLYLFYEELGARYR